MNISGRLVRLMAAGSLILFGACKSPTDSTIVNIVITDTTSVNNGGGDGNGGGGVIGGGGQCASGQNPSITFSPNSASGNVGDTQPVTATISCGPTAGTLSTTNTNGSVISSGLATFVNAGTFQVCYTLTSGFKACSGTWTTNGSNEIPLESLFTSQPSLGLNYGQGCTSQAFQLGVTYVPSNTTQRNVTWSSSDTTVATVSSSGLVMPKGVGNAIITVTGYGGKSSTTSVVIDSCGNGGGNDNLTVPSDTVEISLCTNGASGTTTYQMELFVNGVKANHSDLIFMVDSNGISVSPSGLVTPVALGWHRVRVALKSRPNDTETVWFHVTNTGCQAAPSTVTPSDPVNIGSGTGCTNNTVQFTASAGGTWASSNTSIATINSSGLVTSVPNANGSVTITFTPSNGGPPRLRTVNVSNASCTPAENNQVLSVTVSPSSAEIPIGGQMTFTYTVQTTGNTPTTATWQNAGDGCYTILNTSGSNVTIQGVKACTSTTIKAVATADHSKVGTATVVVTSGVSSIDYTPPGGTIRKDSTVVITAQCVTQAGYACNPYYTSNHPELITVNGNGSPVTIGGVTYPAGTTATLKAVWNSPDVDVRICVQAAVQDNVIQTCHVWRTAP